MNKKLVLSIVLIIAIVLSMPLTALSSDKLSAFDYDANIYNDKLALECANYSYLAYEWANASAGAPYTKSNAPLGLKSALKQQGYSNIKHYNYSDEKEHNASYTIASKQVIHNGQKRNLTLITIRGTDSVEWKGNMDIMGSAYDSKIENHYSFDKAALAIKSTLTKKYLSDDSNALVLITGHSRGGAVGNLLAEKLTAEKTAGIDSSSIYAYTFAAPNCTLKPQTELKNIYNFVFDDDLVPQVPLSSWGYGRHGTTFTASAQELYKSNASFKADLDSYSIKDDAQKFDSEKIYDLLDFIAENCKSAYEYYGKAIEGLGLPSFIPSPSLYSIMKNFAAPALIQISEDKPIDSIVKAAGSLSAFLKNSNMGDFFSQFLSSHVSDTHHMSTYYLALKNGAFN